VGSLSSEFEPLYAANKGISYGKRLLPQVLDKLARENPDHTIGIITNPGTLPALSFTSLRSSQLAIAVNFTSHWLSDLLGKDPYETIPFIGLQDFRYWVMTLASIKTGHPLFLASPGNAVPNTVSLLNAANCDVLCYSGGGSPLELHVKALESAIPSLRIHEIPSLEQTIIVKAFQYRYNKTYEDAKRDTVLILHTSGSTGNPKPIPLNNAYLRRTDCDVLAPVPVGRILADLTLSRKKGLCYLGAPLFHKSGTLLLSISLFKGTTIALGPPDLPTSGEVACAIVRSVKLSGITTVPFIEDAVFRAHGEEPKDQLLDLDHIFSFGGKLFLSPSSARTSC
jgi:acyl-CoA synthetase (AMP-forming)/AMP-acid ligase II